MPTFSTANQGPNLKIPINDPHFSPNFGAANAQTLFTTLEATLSCMQIRLDDPLQKLFFM
jgi:hypothetical protein